MATKITTDEYFGGCPECGKCDGFLNLGRDHWAICSEHRTRWCFGSNLLSSWRNETEEDWQRNREKLADYQKVEPLDPEITYCPRCGSQSIGGSITLPPHSPLCQDADGNRTKLSKRTVKIALEILDRQGFYITQNPELDPSEEIPF